jgi:hypothetical protein
MTFRTLVGMLVLLLASITSGWSLADTDSHRQAVARLFELTHMQRLIDDSADRAVSLQIAQSPALAAHKEALQAFMQKYIGWRALKDNLTAMYLQAFTEAELDQMNAFYSSPTGQKVLEQMPELVQRRNQLAMQRLRKHIGELQEAIASEPGE